MAARVGISTKEFLTSVTLPQHGGRYTVIPHKFIIDNALEQLALNNLIVDKELYRCSINGEIATGIYHIKHEQDEELGMVFAWSNSYDKTMRFKCAVGAYVYTSQNLILKKDMGSWGRKHTGTADSETLITITNQILNAKESFDRIISDKNKMKSITVTKQRAAELMGRLFLEKELLTGEQMTIIKSLLKSPKFDYKSPENSLWVFYNHISLSLQKAHPKTWMDQQRLTNWFLCEEFDLNKVEVQEEVVVNNTPSIINQDWVEEVATPYDEMGETASKLAEPYHQMTIDEAIAQYEKEQVEKAVVIEEVIEVKVEPAVKLVIVEAPKDDLTFDLITGPINKIQDYGL